MFVLTCSGLADGKYFKFSIHAPGQIHLKDKADNIQYFCYSHHSNSDFPILSVALDPKPKYYLRRKSLKTGDNYTLSFFLRLRVSNFLKKKYRHCSF